MKGKEGTGDPGGPDAKSGSYSSGSGLCPSGEKGFFADASPARTRSRGGIFQVIPAPSLSGAHAHSFAGLGPICYHVFLTGTGLGYEWGGGLSGDRGREGRKSHLAPAC